MVSPTHEPPSSGHPFIRFGFVTFSSRLCESATGLLIAALGCPTRAHEENQSRTESKTCSAKFGRDSTTRATQSRVLLDLSSTKFGPCLPISERVRPLGENSNFFEVAHWRRKRLAAQTPLGRGSTAARWRWNTCWGCLAQIGPNAAQIGPKLADVGPCRFRANFRRGWLPWGHRLAELRPILDVQYLTLRGTAGLMSARRRCRSFSERRTRTCPPPCCSRCCAAMLCGRPSAHIITPKPKELVGMSRQ